MKLTLQERQRRISEGLRLAWMRRKQKTEVAMTAKVIEKENGHEWCEPHGPIRHEFCRRCLLIRRVDKKSNPCKGPAKVVLR